MSGLASDEVAEDYKNSLEDLTTNDKFQISNLTVIAKENTEHAMAISRVLENHIRTTPPSQKLPALYVVDSVVKNVGTPYTLFLGRNLYQTFMNAYTLVDSQTRKKLDEMLKTWKEPVPGSLDPRPVFPVEITRSIENALIKARTAALQQQQARQQQDLRTWNRGVSTPPPAWKSVLTPPQGPAQQAQTNGQKPSDPYQARYTQTTPSQYPPITQQQQYGQSHPEIVDLASLHRDIDNLIMSARNDFANRPLDSSVQQRLKALLDLQSILQQQKLPQEQLKLIRDQVSKLAIAAPPTPVPVPAAPVPTTAVQTPSIPTLTTHTPPPNLQALLNPTTLASLIKATANSQNRTPPPPPPAPLAQVFPQQAPASSSNTPSISAPVVTENPLIASLRARGLLPPVLNTPPQQPPANLPFLLPSQNGYTPSTTPQLPTQTQTDIKISVQMSSASIKVPRPNLIFRLYEEKPNRCGTCGRRFAADDAGKEKKARHLDWHFKTNLRMNEASKRGQSRSWYVDERDWIKSREYDDDVDITDAMAASAGKSGGQDGAAQNAPQQRWIHAPNDAALRNTPCPICQEHFESTWSEEAQDWIWRDAIKVGNRVYHASCYSELTKDGTTAAIAGSATPLGRTGTPDSVLGKRKAEVRLYGCFMMIATNGS
ncbi:conserved hypothetical protein [Uncinocarpus reesii 1704]|uniref:CID domain-containing protein n=1 Tax=Uncinocarpus reesii (strain UAMH 1704) TaxID=336963 RepID=C4JPN2_UNCRE|nr:uncharacterized protein UREG_03204 [Uncinocarpus reesii 1704]EEP78358.1 conserved hypothetical protein [Uncinocarpus reesii 1704]